MGVSGRSTYTRPHVIHMSKTASSGVSFQVGVDINAGLAAELTLQEFHTVTLSLQNSRTPGIGGLLEVVLDTF